MKKFIALLLLISNLIALEFGQIGNTPSSVGGAGVAYKKNAWAVYYNPALLGANRQASIAYSFGVGYADSNVLELASINVKSLDNLQSEFDKLTSPTNGGGQQGKKIQRKAQGRNGGTQTNDTKWNFKDLGLLGSVLGQLTNKTDGSGTSEDLKTYLCNKVKNGGNGNDCTLENVKDKLSNKQEVLSGIQKDLETAIHKTEETNPEHSTILSVLESIVENFDPSQIPDLVESVKDGNISVKTILEKVGASGIKISKDSAPALSGVFTIAETIDKNALNISSNNGIAWHIKGNKDRGAIGMGILANVYGFAGVEMDSARKEIIIQNGSDYFKVGISGDKITLGTADENGYNNSSILSSNANHKLHANGIALTEIPLSYGHSIPLPLGDLHLGATIKYIFAVSIDNTQKFNFDNPKFDFNVRDNLRYTHTFGVDLGALWTLDWLSTGIVMKNLNAPTIRTANGKYRILPQVRAGVSAEIWKLTFLADIDLTPNDTLEPGKKNQMVGGGVILDLRWVDFRFGVMGDMHKNPYGPIFTAGLNIAHFLDFTIQSSAKLIDIKDANIGVDRLPNYFKVSVGGRFQW